MKYNSVLKLIIIMAILFAATVSTSAQYTADTVFIFLQEVYDKQDKKLYDFLITEFDQFAENFPDSKNATEITFFSGKIYMEKGWKYKAIATYFKTMFLYPNSPQRSECADLIREIISEKRIDRDKAEKIHLILNSEFGGETAADRYYAYLKFLIELDESNIYDWMLVESRRFISRFPDYQHIDMVLRWIGDIYTKKGKPKEAVISYLKLDYTHPNSPLLAYTRYHRALLQYKKLGNYEQAMTIFNMVVSVFPESEFGPASLFMVGEIKEKKMKDYEGAITEYKSLVINYPQHEKAVAALFSIAEISSKKLKDYFAAVEAYNEIVEKYQSNSRAIEALTKIGDIYKDKIRNFSKSAEYYAKIVELYPDYDKGPDMLLKAAAVCEKKLKDYQKAIEYYQLILEKFPEHKKAKDAEKKLVKAEEKLAEEK